MAEINNYDQLRWPGSADRKHAAWRTPGASVTLNGVYERNSLENRRIELLMRHEEVSAPLSSCSRENVTLGAV